MPAIRTPYRIALAAAGLLAALVLVIAFASRTEAQNAGYLFFPGPGSGWIEVPDDPALEPTSAITLEAWVYLYDHDAITTSNEPTIIGKDYADSYLFTIWNGSLRFYPGSGADSVIGTTVLPLNQWVHVAATYDNATVNLYINGVLDKSEALPGQLGTSASPLRIGSDVQWTPTPQGSLDEVRLWNIVRTQAEIAADMNTTITTAQTGLVAVWNMEGTANSDVGGFTGTLGGDATFQLTPTDTPTPSPSPSPTAPVGQTLIWGDADCNGSIAPRDSQAGLKHFLSQAELSQTPPCPTIGSSITFGGVSYLWGDNDCNGSVAPRDGQAGLKHFLSQAELSQTPPCPVLGTTGQVSP